MESESKPHQDRAEEQGGRNASEFLGPNQHKDRSVEKGHGLPPLDEFKAFAEKLDPDIGPMFGRDAARLVDAYDSLFEQYEALQAAARKFLATGNEIDLADLTTPGEYLYDLIPHRWPDDYEDNAPYPASRQEDA